MQDFRVRMTIVVALLVMILGGGAGLWAARRPAPPPIVISGPGISPSPTAVTPPSAMTPAPPAPKPTPAPDPRYYVHVAGAVRNPSLYLLAPGSRVMQAIKAAGGPTSKADLDAVNLAEKVKDGEKIYIPNKAAAVQAAMIAPPGNSLGHDSSTADAPPPSVAPAIKPSKVTKSDKSSGGKSSKLTSPAQGQININTAGNDQLQRLPGVGPAMAGRILAYRQQAGGFQKVEELQEISGIGPKKYAKIAPLVKLQ